MTNVRSGFPDLFNFGFFPFTKSTLVMNTNVTLFSQILRLIDRNAFAKVVREHNSDKHNKGLNTWTHFVSMLFCHLAKSNSIREICNGLRSAAGNLNHLGVKRAPAKSSISYINAHRDHEVFRDIYFKLLEQFESDLQRRRKYARRLRRKIFILDATTISLCLQLFDWALYRQRKGAIKVHTTLDYDTSLPVYLHLTDGKKHDVQVAKTLDFPRGSVVVMDRAYVDFEWLNYLDSRGVFFVTRLKDNAQIEVLRQFMTDGRHEHILDDADIRMTGFYTSRKYPDKLRTITVYDKKNDQTIVLLTNNFIWTADTISQLYKARWDIETFFKHIKQALKIKTFVGTSPNAVLIQIWTAMITILLLKYLKNKATYGWHLSNLVGFLRICLFAKINLWEWLNHPFVKMNDPPSHQLELF
jgi:hypothetical protein